MPKFCDGLVIVGGFLHRQKLTLPSFPPLVHLLMYRASSVAWTVQYADPVWWLWILIPLVFLHGVLGSCCLMMACCGGSCSLLLVLIPPPFPRRSWYDVLVKTMMFLIPPTLNSWCCCCRRVDAWSRRRCFCFGTAVLVFEYLYVARLFDVRPWLVSVGRLCYLERYGYCFAMFSVVGSPPTCNVERCFLRCITCDNKLA